MAKIQKSWGCSIESLKLFEDKCETFETMNSTFAYKLTAPTAGPPPPPSENTCCKQNNVLMSLKPSICSMVIFSQADWYALSILFGILPALIKKKAQVITTCSYTHSCRHLPKDYWNETNDLNNDNCENRKKEEKKHFCFGGANRNAYVLNTLMNRALPSGSSGT